MAARNFQRRNPLDPIYLKLRRFLLRGLIECIDQVIKAADRAAVDLFDRVAIDDWYQLILFARLKPRFPQWALLVNAVNSYAAANRELTKCVNDIHHRRGDQNNSQRP